MTTHTPAPTPQDPISEAILLLTEEADSLSDCHTRTPGDWAGEPEAKAHYDHVLAVIASLSKLRAPVVDERELPSLPEPESPAAESFADGWKEWPATPDYFTAEQMRDYDRAALASAHVAGDVAPPEWADRFPEISDMGRLNEAWRAASRSAPVAGDAHPFASAGPLAGQFAEVMADNYDSLLVRIDAAPQASEAVRDAVARRDTGKDRLSFHIWALVHGMDITPNDSCGYVSPLTQHAWMKWNPPESAALSAQPGAQKGCNCATCRPLSVEMRMILCETCGDKRCPHAADHRNACTGSHPDHKDGGAVYG